MLFTIINIAYFLLFVTEFLLSRLLRSNDTDQQNLDKKSISFIWITIVMAISLSVYISFAIDLPISQNLLIREIGVGVLLLGIGVRLSVVFALGKFFTVDVTIRKDHQLKTDGFYKYLRHPSYSASLLSFVGMALTLNNWLSMVLLLSAVFFAFAKRVQIEEEALLQHFGQAYLDYQKTTFRMIPFVY
jgi:protein-S-isoprenylcysteine O-methyltransferase Ste14